MRRHPGPFHDISALEFDRLLAALRADLARLSDARIVVALQEAVAALGEAHTYVDLPTGDVALAFSTLPVEFRVFEDELYVTRTQAGLEELAAARVVRLGDLPAEEALARVRRFVSQDNPSTADYLAPSRLRMAEVLRGLSISSGAASVDIEVETAGETRIRHALRPIPSGREGDWYEPRDTARLRSSLYWRAPDEPYWFLSIGRGVLYVQLNRTISDPTLPMDRFARELSAEIDREAPRRLILDLRRNVGGNWNEARPLVRAILRQSAFYEPGRLVILIGRGTISAAVVLVQELSRHTESVLVGEPTGSRPNQFGDNEPRLVLPHSGLEVSIATAYYQTGGPYEFRRWVAPDVYVPATASAYFAVEDPALDEALAYEPSADLETELRELIEAGRATEVAGSYRRFCELERNRFVETERLARRIAADLVDLELAESAVTVSRLNAERYPDRARPRVVLAEALIALGRMQEANREIERALELLPADPSLTVTVRDRVRIYVQELQKGTHPP